MNKSSCTPHRILAVAWLSFAAAAHAHEGHDDAADHDHDTAVASAPAPVGTATTPQVEMVVAREQKDIVIYIDDYASNAPVDGLQVQLRSGNQLLQASAAGDGVYRLPADLIDAREDVPATFLLHGKSIDLQLQSVIPAAQPAGESAASEPRNRKALLAELTGILLAVIVVWRVIAGRRRARNS